MQLEKMGQTLLSTIEMAEEAGHRSLIEAAIETARIAVVDVPLAVTEPALTRAATWRSPLVLESPLDRLIRLSISEEAAARERGRQDRQTSGLVEAPSTEGK
jgi:hypothetical protein